MNAIDDHIRHLNDHLVVPAYRLFCREADLRFHFWNEIPQSEFDSGIARRELALHQEAMYLFNEIKPHWTFFDGHLVRYEFTSPLDFDHESMGLGDGLLQFADASFSLQKLAERFESVCVYLVAAVFFLSYLPTAWLLLSFLPGSPTLWGLVAFIPASAVSVWLWRTLRRSLPKRIIDDGRLDGLRERVNSLRAKLAAIRTDHDSPLHGAGTAPPIFATLEQNGGVSMTAELVVQLQKKLLRSARKYQ